MQENYNFVILSSTRAASRASGAKLLLHGAKLLFLGVKLLFLGAKPLFLGAKPLFLGAKLLFLGVKPLFLGAKPLFHGVKPLFHGVKLRWRGLAARADELYSYALFQSERGAAKRTTDVEACISPLQNGEGPGVRKRGAGGIVGLGTGCKARAGGGTS
jgi:hypothetical protein